MLSGVSEWFWQERLWFPKGLGWDDLRDRDGRVYAKAQDLWVALPIALVFLVIRQIFERLVCLLRISVPLVKVFAYQFKNSLILYLKNVLPCLLYLFFDFSSLSIMTQVTHFGGTFCRHPLTPDLNDSLSICLFYLKFVLVF